MDEADKHAAPEMCSAKAATSAPGLVPKQISTGDRTIIEQHNGLA